MGFFDFLFGRGKSDRDGSSPQKAIVVGSIPEEYQWVQRNCRGFTFYQQALQHIDGKPYDVLFLRSETGEERRVYFDISSFFGQ